MMMFLARLPTRHQIATDGRGREGAGWGRGGETMNTSETTAVGEAPSSLLSNQRWRPGVSPSHESKSQRMSAAVPLPAIIYLLLLSTSFPATSPLIAAAPETQTMMDVSSAGRQVPSLLGLSAPRRRLAGERDVKRRTPLGFFAPHSQSAMRWHDSPFPATPTPPCVVVVGLF